MDRAMIVKVLLACGLAAVFLVVGLETIAVQGRAEKKNMSDENVNIAIRKATFAGGCFWCSEADFEKLPGVVEVISGYTAGHIENPTYAEVSSGESGHAEAVEVRYDPEKITYERLLDAFWMHIDPTDAGGQFADRGRQYRSAIFYHDAEQKRLAEESKDALERSGKFKEPIVTEISEAVAFYEAEAYHQDYYKKSSANYKAYRRGSGRDRFIQSTWGDEKKGGMSRDNVSYTIPDDSTLRTTLTPLQYKVTRKDGTEPPFSNEYWDNKRDGIYVDIASGEPLFSSLDKFKSGTGWPSFMRPLEPDRVVEKEDRSLFMKRVELRSRDADSHLGHVFPDGPAPTGLRYCINSAALRFVPVEDLEKKGYGKYTGLFEGR